MEEVRIKVSMLIVLSLFVISYLFIVHKLTYFKNEFFVIMLIVMVANLIPYILK